MISSDLIAAYAARHTASIIPATPDRLASEIAAYVAQDRDSRTEAEALRLEARTWERSYRDLHRAFTELARSLASIREEVQIDGTVYAINTDDPDADMDAMRVTLEKKFVSGSEPRTVSGGFADDCLTAGPNKGYSCDCPDFRHRHAGTGSPGCKHIRSLAAFGRLPERGDAIEALGTGEHAAYDPWADHVAAESAALAARFNR